MDFFFITLMKQMEIQKFNLLSSPIHCYRS